MLGHVQTTMSQNPLISLISGPIFGVPYKLFASVAPNYVEYTTFIIFTIPARLLRFIIVTCLAYYLSHQLFSYLNEKLKTIIWLIIWILVYVIYFGIHGF